MPILKKSDIAASDILSDYIKQVNLATEATKKLQQQIRGVNKTGAGSEAKERVDLANKITKATNQVVVAQTKQAEQLERLNMEKREAKQLNKANATLNNKLAGTEEKLLATNTKLRLERKKLNTETKKGRQELVRINAQLDKNNAKLKANADQLKKQRLGIGRYANAMKNVGKQMLTMFGGMTALFAVIGVIKNAVNIFIEFSKSSSRLAAILGKTKGEIKALTEQAKELGATTAFTASQIIGLQTELAKLGFSLEQIEASTEGILDLAAATGHDLAESATLAGATLRIFNLDASEAGRVADVLAKSTSKSALDMSKLATALPIVGKTADIAGLSLEHTTAILGTLTNRGIDASTAATALRNVFLRLSKTGLTWDQAMKRIQESTDKNKTSMEIFGVRAATAGIILSQTAGSTAELTEALNNAEGAAKAMAKTMLDNLAGDITIANSAWQGFILSIEDGEGIISKAMRSVVQDFTDFLNQLTLFNETTIANKLRLIANAAISLFEKAFLPLAKVLDALGIKMPRFRLAVEETEKKEKNLGKSLGFVNGLLKMQSDQLTQLTKDQLAASTSTKELTKEQKALNAELLRRQKVSKGFGDLGGISSVGIEGVQVGLTDDQIKANKKSLEDGLTKIVQTATDNRNRIRIEAAEETAEAEALILEQLQTSAVQLARDIFSAFQDEKLARINSDAEAQKKILQDRLDKGEISEEQFASQIAAIENKQRIESAKADKKKALFDIGIRTAIAIIAALTSIPPNVPLSIAVGITGAIQAAAVLATPIPKFDEGGEIGGKSHSQGGTLLEGEKGEFMVNKEAYSNAPDITNMINDGLLTDKGFSNMNNQNANMLLASLLMSGNKTSDQMLVALMNLGYTYDRGKERIIIKADGSNIERFNI